MVEITRSLMTGEYYLLFHNYIIDAKIYELYFEMENYDALWLSYHAKYYINSLYIFQNIKDAENLRDYLNSILLMKELEK